MKAWMKNNFIGFPVTSVDSCMCVHERKTDWMQFDVTFPKVTKLAVS